MTLTINCVPPEYVALGFFIELIVMSIIFCIIKIPFIKQAKKTAIQKYQDELLAGLNYRMGVTNGKDHVYENVYWDKELQEWITKPDYDIQGFVRDKLLKLSDSNKDNLNNFGHIKENWNKKKQKMEMNIYTV